MAQALSDMQCSAQTLHVLDERGMLAPAGELAFNDAPWVPEQSLRFVHPKISNEARLSSCSCGHAASKLQ